MHLHERKALEQIVERLKERFNSIVSVYVFGSRVRGDYDEWSDLDILVVVKNKTPELEAEIIGIFVDEEMKSGLSFTPVIKDVQAFETEKKFKTPFYENIMKEGILL